MPNLLISKQAVESAATEMNPARGNSGDKSDLRKAVWSIIFVSLEHITDIYQTIFSDAILGMLNAPAKSVNGLLDLDEDFLRKYCGVSDFSKYSIVPGSSPRRMMPKEMPVLEVEEQDDEGTRMDSTSLRKTKL